MKKSVAMKMFLIMLVFVLCMSITGLTFAADTQNELDDVEDLDLTSNSANNTSTGNVAGNNTATNNSNKNLSTNLISSGNNTTLKTNNTANTNLPKTGLGDSMPTVLLVVVFVISAGYAYKKIKEYRNI